MPIAAVPDYLRKHLGFQSLNCPPGHRFNLYFPVWTEDFAKKPDASSKVAALKSVLPMQCGSEIGKSLAARTSAQMTGLLTTSSNAVFSLTGTNIAPFASGLGNEHPLENGFAFLNPYGLPYLPGSGVKGVLRAAAAELASGESSDSGGWCEAHDFSIAQDSAPALNLSIIDVLFGVESKAGDTQHLRGVLSFWDVVPVVEGDKLLVEIMTPHQSHYYQEGKTPHDSGKPNPIGFLTVPPKSKFAFHVTCDFTRLNLIAPALAENDRWKALLQSAFAHAFDWLGFGAKTAVGYGAMMEDAAAKIQREAAQTQQQQVLAAAKREKELGEMTDEDRSWALNEPVIAAFSDAAAKAQLKTYQPGSAFDAARLAFATAASQWTDTTSREAAGTVLWATLTKAWGMPSNKERKKQLQDTAQALLPKATT